MLRFWCRSMDEVTLVGRIMRRNLRLRFLREKDHYLDMFHASCPLSGDLLVALATISHFPFYTTVSPIIAKIFPYLTITYTNCCRRPHFDSHMASRMISNCTSSVPPAIRNMRLSLLIS
jgi:hypothetical protein